MTNALEDDVLRFIRNGGADRIAPELGALTLLVADHTGVDVSTVDGQSIRRFVFDMCDRNLVENTFVSVHLIEQMLAPSDKRRTITRSDCRELLRAYLLASRPPGATLTQRRIEEIEKAEISPAVIAALRSPVWREQLLPEYRWRNFNVELSVLPSRVAEVVTVRICMEFDSKPESLVFAITDDEDFADSLCTAYPWIADVYVPSPTLTGTVCVYYLNEVSGCFVPLEMEVISPSSEIAELVGSEPIQHLIDRKVTLQQYVPVVTIIEPSIRTRVVSEMDVNIVAGYCYWSAPRGLHLRGIRANLGGFPGRDEYKFRFTKRLAVPVRARTSQAEAFFELICDSHLSSGGVSIQVDWKRK